VLFVDGFSMLPQQVKYYKKTPAYDAKLFHAAYGLLPLALAGKLVATAVLYQVTTTTLFTETEKQSPNTGARANNTLHK